MLRSRQIRLQKLVLKPNITNFLLVGFHYKMFCTWKIDRLSSKQFNAGIFFCQDMTYSRSMDSMIQNDRLGKIFTEYVVQQKCRHRNCRLVMHKEIIMFAIK